MAKLFNRAKMTTTTTGTGTITLGSASNGFQSFADAGVADGDVIQYVIEEGSNFEIGTGTYSSSGTTLTRTPTESSNIGSAITLAGQATVSITAIHADFSRLQHEGSDKVTVSSTGASVTGNITVTGTVDGVDVATFKSDYDSHNHDGRYYTETEADSRFVNVTGDTMTGNLTVDKNTPRIDFKADQSGSNVGGRIELNENGNLWLNAQGGKDLWLNWLAPTSAGSYADLNVGDGNSGSYILRVEGSSRTVSINGNTAFHDGYHPNADKWTTARTLSLSGDASGSVSWDGSANATLSVSVSDADAVAFTGYGSGEFTAYQTSGNWQTWTGGWATHLIGNHGDGASYYNQTIIMPFWGAPQYMRKEGGNNVGPFKFWTQENDGSGSGLDADTVDGQHASALGVPSGVICMWSGTNANIPSGWYLCDGTNGTPDLRDRFIVGSGSSYTTGNTGGAASVTLTTAQMPSHTHSGPSHTHTFSGTTSSSGAHSFAARNSYSGWNGAAAGNGGQRYTLGGPNHTHTFSGTTDAASGTTGSAGSGQSHENRPPYYALAYIMKS